jgi:hypothetical protein
MLGFYLENVNNTRVFLDEDSNIALKIIKRIVQRLNLKNSKGD